MYQAENYICGKPVGYKRVGEFLRTSFLTGAWAEDADANKGKITGLRGLGLDGSKETLRV